MKQFLFTAFTFILSVSFLPLLAQDQTAMVDKAAAKSKPKANKVKKVSEQAATQSMPMAYTATYSAQFAMGNPAHSQMVMNLIKDYETNAFAMGEAFADTVTAIFSDGKLVKGKEQMTDAFKQSRATTGDHTIRISAFIPVRSTDKGEDWVLVWGTLVAKEGTRDFHHIWRINRDGKVDFLQLFQGQTPEM